MKLFVAALQLHPTDPGLCVTAANSLQQLSKTGLWTDQGASHWASTRPAVEAVGQNVICVCVCVCACVVWGLLDGDVRARSLLVVRKGENLRGNALDINGLDVV